MQGSAFGLLCILAVICQAVAYFNYDYDRYTKKDSMPVDLIPRDDDEFDPSDLSSLVNLAAIGDSYSAGIGAGGRLGSVGDALSPQSDYACSRYNNSYPYLVSIDSRFGDTLPNFQFLSCSGAVTQDVLQTQIPNMNSNQNAIMLSIGGNDVELTNILNQCVFQWAVFNWEQVKVAEVAAAFDKKYDWAKGYDFEALGRGCDGQLSRTASLIESSDFSASLDAVLSAALAKLADGGKIYWTGFGNLYSGFDSALQIAEYPSIRYARFFAEDMSPACDHVTWTTWTHKTYNIWQPAQYLTSANRQTMNDLVDMINAQMEAAAKRAGSNVIFIDYDSYVGYFGGRFCEAGVNESTIASTTRPDLMFYELNSQDPLGTTPWKRSTVDNLNGTFDGDINVFAEVTSVMDPDAQFADSEANTVMTEDSTLIKSVEDVTVGGISVPIPNLLPDGYGRVFHPQILLHRLIANLVMFNMANVMEISNGLDPLPQNLTIDSCPIITNATAPGFYGRILPLGASIVWGKGSTTGNGFRKPLRDALRQAGWEINMVGSKNNGDMKDNNVEATIGDRVDQIQVKSTLSTKYQPNIIIINAGTNDCLQYYKLAEFTTRYNSLLDSLYAAIPDVTIIVSTVIPGTADGIPQNRDYVNSQIRALVDDRQRRGQKIVLADIDIDIPTGSFTTQYLISDGIHPNDEGHRLLAALYLQAIEEANAMRFIMPPAETGLSDAAGGPSNTTCDKTFASGETHGAQTQQGSGLDDGIYVHNSISRGIRGTIYSDPGTNWTFARLREPFGFHDLLWITNDLYQGQRQYGIFMNNPDGYFMGGLIGFFQLQDTCIARGVRFVDVNADGLDDMVCIAVNGDTYVSINQGNYSFTDGGLWKPNEGSPQDRVLLADIDGDGRTDYCTIADNGDISCWRNGGQGDLPEYWQTLGVIFKGKGFGDVHGVRFFDLNGDGRDDWIWMDDTGKTWTYSNNRGCAKGTLEPLWRAGTNANGGDGYTHAGMGQKVERNSIHFANLFTGGHFVFGGSQQPYLNPRADYVWIEDTGPGPGTTKHVYKLHMWQNQGSGATKLKSDGDRYCNMLGHANGAMDYVWVHSTGYMILYESFGGIIPAVPPYWGPHYQIWTPEGRYKQAIDRRDLHLADWNGDGLCDIIYVDPDTNEMDVWLNQYKNGGDITKWVLQSNAGPRANRACQDKRGVGIFDLAVRFADIDGNNRTDYLCIEPNGRTWGYLNKDDGSLEYISQIKKSEDKDRANLRWVDVNGDGRDDLLWVDKFNGDATVWYNRGPIPASGSAYTWENKGIVYQGAGQGPCENFPDLNGDGRADMSFADNLENTAWTWFNLCPGEGGSDNGDDLDTLTSPPLPAIPGL